MVVFADIDEEAAQAAAEISKKHASNPEYRPLVYKVDITDADSVQNMMAFTIKECGRVDYAVNSAGVSYCSQRPLRHHRRADINWFLRSDREPLICSFGRQQRRRLRQGDGCQCQRNHAMRTRATQSNAVSRPSFIYWPNGYAGYRTWRNCQPRIRNGTCRSPGENGLHNLQARRTRYYQGGM